MPVKVASIAEIHAFLLCKTPDSWLKTAVKNIDILLIDHANCEKKAASTALSLLYRYQEYPDIMQRMSRLAREELRHFEQVHKIMQARGVSYQKITSARYAEGLHKHASRVDPKRLIDILIIGAIIEARSCERFYALVPYLDAELAKFYSGLLASEARHFLMYLSLAKKYADFDINQRVEEFLCYEKDLILSVDLDFKFHSGVPK